MKRMHLAYLGLIGILFIGGIGGYGLGSGIPVSARDLGQPGMEGTADGFGYWYEPAAYNWIEINTLDPLPFLSDSYSYIGPLELGFSFPFYENVVSQVYLTTNGLLTFDQAYLSYSNAHIPLTATPSNLIAPLWTDTPLGAGKVYVQADTAASPKRFIVEWEGTGSTDDPVPLTYQAILYETGDIVFQYKQVGVNLNSLTIGIEDPDGYEGLQYLYNLPGLAASSAVHIHRPAPSQRVKILPRLQGGFVSLGVGRNHLAVKNTGEVGNTVYDLSVTSSTPGWTTRLYTGAGTDLMVDTNGNGIPDTGAIAPNGLVTVTLETHSPDGAPEGSFTSLNFVAAAALSPGASANATIQLAIPMQFAQVFVNHLGIRLGQYWNVNVIERPVLNLYTGASMSMESVSQNDYLVAWEYLTSGGGKNFTDIHYKIVNRLTGGQAEKTLTNGLSVVTKEPNLVTADARNPSIAVDTDGNIALAWSLFKLRPVANRKSPYVIASDTHEKNTNIYFNLLDAATRSPILSEALNLTADSGWYGTAYSHNYVSPAAAVTANGSFYACWVDQVYSQVNTPSTTIFCSVFRYSGGQLTRTRGPILMDTTSGGVSLLNLTLVPAGSNRVMLAYTELSAGSQSIVYSIWNDQGSPVVGRSVVAGSDGIRPRLVTFGLDGSGDALLVWEANNGQIAYAFLDAASSYALYPGYPQYLAQVGDRSSGSLSVTLERKGRALITWMDFDNNEYMYYAVLDSARAFITPPMIFMTMPAGSAGLLTSEYGFGNANYQGVYQVFLPLARKK